MITTLPPRMIAGTLPMSNNAPKIVEYAMVDVTDSINV
jgi:hypothetical protein